MNAAVARFEPDGGIVVEAAVLAAAFGVTEEQLKAEMRRGLVFQVAERGIGEDAGRWRLTFRWRAREVRMVLDPAGRIVHDG